MAHGAPQQIGWQLMTDEAPQLIGRCYPCGTMGSMRPIPVDPINVLAPVPAPPQEEHAEDVLSPLYEEDIEAFPALHISLKIPSELGGDGSGGSTGGFSDAPENGVPVNAVPEQLEPKKAEPEKAEPEKAIRKVRRWWWCSAVVVQCWGGGVGGVVVVMMVVVVIWWL